MKFKVRQGAISKFAPCLRFSYFMAIVRSDSQLFLAMLRFEKKFYM